MGRDQAGRSAEDGERSGGPISSGWGEIRRADQLSMGRDQAGRSAQDGERSGGPIS